MAAAFFLVLGLLTLVGVPLVAVVWSYEIGMTGVFVLSGSSIGLAILLFALAVIIDRLDKIVAISAKAGV